eukprot:m.1715 g.1715  ORF g.1715 m.1715 type:complete len:52 (-) comp1179_c0_seq1:109-264(-)
MASTGDNPCSLEFEEQMEFYAWKFLKLVVFTRVHMIALPTLINANTVAFSG